MALRIGWLSKEFDAENGGKGTGITIHVNWLNPEIDSAIQVGIKRQVQKSEIIGCKSE